MNTMMTTSLRKISVISMIIIIMSESLFASSVGTKKTCKDWILAYDYKESLFFNGKNLIDNHALAQKRNGQVDDTNISSGQVDDSNISSGQVDDSNISSSQVDDSNISSGQVDDSNISIFALVYGQYIAQLDIKDVIKPSAFCKRIGLKSKYTVFLTFKGTKLHCTEWLTYYGYSLEDGNAKLNWKKAQKLNEETLFQYIHGITKSYINDLKRRQKENSLSAIYFCETHYGNHLYVFDTGIVTKPTSGEQHGYEIPTSTIASSSNSDDVALDG